MNPALRTTLFVVMLVALAVPAAAAEVVAIVSPDNPVRALDRAQIADIFLGKAARFPDGRKARPVDMPEHSAERAAFYAVFAERTLAQVKMHWAKLIFTGRGQPPARARDATEMKRLIAEDPDAIGYIDRSDVDDSVVVVDVIEAQR